MLTPLLHYAALYLGPVSEELPKCDQQLSNFIFFKSPNCLKQDGTF